MPVPFDYVNKAALKLFYQNDFGIPLQHWLCFGKLHAQNCNATANFFI